MEWLFFRRNPPWGMRLVGGLAGAAWALLLAAGVHAQTAVSGCGPLDNPYGPFDYRNQKNKLDIVEKFHFTPSVESLVSGKSTVNVGGDLDYTLRAFPNHHRALMAMVRLGDKLKSPQPPGVGYSIECYFERALRFRPDDSTVRMLYATYLSKGAREPEALQQLEQAATHAGDNPFTHYNLGLVYFDLRHYDLALAQAHLAYGLGFTQPALRERLQRVGKWKDPEDKP
jgi:hypothetical protein